jgi:hypothetical protein
MPARAGRLLIGDVIILNNRFAGFLYGIDKTGIFETGYILHPDISFHNDPLRQQLFPLRPLKKKASRAIQPRDMKSDVLRIAVAYTENKSRI